MISIFPLEPDETTISLNISDTLMETKCFNLGLCKGSVLSVNFYEPLWVHQDKMVSMQDFNCEDVAKWVATIKGMPYDSGPTLVRNDVNGAELLVMGCKHLK